MDTGTRSPTSTTAGATPLLATPPSRLFPAVAPSSRATGARRVENEGITVLDGRADLQ